MSLSTVSYATSPSMCRLDRAKFEVDVVASHQILQEQFMIELQHLRSIYPSDSFNLVPPTGRQVIERDD